MRVEAQKFGPRPEIDPEHSRAQENAKAQRISAHRDGRHGGRAHPSATPRTHTEFSLQRLGVGELLAGPILPDSPLSTRVGLGVPPKKSYATEQPNQPPEKVFGSKKMEL